MGDCFASEAGALRLLARTDTVQPGTRPEKLGVGKSLAKCGAAYDKADKFRYAYGQDRGMSRNASGWGSKEAQRRGPSKEEGNETMAAGARASVRPARASEAAGIAGIQLRAWRAAYADLIPKLLDGLSANDLAERWRAAIVAPPTPRHRVLVARGKGSSIAGFVATAPANDPDTHPGTDGELVALAVDPEAVRLGHGSRLLSAAADHLRADGFRHAVTWLLSTDDVLRSFLVQAGWAADGAYRDLKADEGAVLRQIRLHTLLEEAP